MATNSFVNHTNKKLYYSLNKNQIYTIYFIVGNITKAIIISFSGRDWKRERERTVTNNTIVLRCCQQ